MARKDERPSVSPIDRGVSRNHERSIYEVARIMGITPQGVWHLERSALRKLRQAFIERGVVNKKGYRL